jgi:hypothetical protein
VAYGIFASLHYYYYRYQWSGTGSPFDGVMNEFFFEDARCRGGNSTILSARGFTLPLFSFSSFAHSFGAWGAMGLGNQAKQSD